MLAHILWQELKPNLIQDIHIHERIPYWLVAAQLHKPSFKACLSTHSILHHIRTQH